MFWKSYDASLRPQELASRIDWLPQMWLASATASRLQNLLDMLSAVLERGLLVMQPLLQLSNILLQGAGLRSKLLVDLGDRHCHKPVIAALSVQATAVIASRN